VLDIQLSNTKMILVLDLHVSLTFSIIQHNKLNESFTYLNTVIDWEFSWKIQSEFQDLILLPDIQPSS
jgi:hypothetical protein